MRVVVTGFPPFPNQPLNPTQRIVEAIQHEALPRTDVQLDAVLLPVEYVGVETAFQELLDEFVPDLVLSFGVGRQTELFRLERIGRNLDNASIPDNAGDLRVDTVIDPNGDDRYCSSLSLDDIATSIADTGASVCVSEDAGAYVCNHLNFIGLQHSQRPENAVQFLFTHVSSLPNGFEIEAALSGINAMVDWFVQR